MTNATINVPRELLADLLGNDHDKRIMAERHLLAMLANAPSPAGVDGMGNTAKLLLPALRQYMHNDGSGLLAGYDLETTQAIIDGLRGENERIRLNIAEYNEAISCYQSERNQQAQRIGELEGLLRSCLPALSDGGCAALANRIDAALAAGKEGE